MEALVIEVDVPPSSWTSHWDVLSIFTSLSEALLYLFPVLRSGGTTDHFVSVVVDVGLTDLRDEVVYGQLPHPKAVSWGYKLATVVQQ